MPIETDPAAPLASIATALRHEREQAGLSLTELARRAGIAKSTLSQLESGSANPSIQTLWSLAAALGVPFGRLVDPPPPRVRVIRAGAGEKIRAERADFAVSLLSAASARMYRDLYLITLEPGEVRMAGPHLKDTVEHIVVSTGRLRTGPTGRPVTGTVNGIPDSPVELRPGDYLAFPADVPHCYEALEPHTQAVLIMEHP